MAVLVRSGSALSDPAAGNGGLSMQTALRRERLPLPKAQMAPHGPMADAPAPPGRPKRRHAKRSNDVAADSPTHRLTD
ncbi:hypothetical protein, partial [Ralstonia solanacearum]|uniref:hypothetical protein n=1 Tax=Ralstonia solanacearum TaxID=305 RepID=UPI001CA5D7F4